MSSLNLNCPFCSKSIRVPTEKISKGGVCPRCKSRFVPANYIETQGTNAETVSVTAEDRFTQGKVNNRIPQQENRKEKQGHKKHDRVRGVELPNRGVAVSGLFLMIFYLMSALSMGLVDWVGIQLLFLLLATVVPYRPKVPLIGWIQRDLESIMKFYINNPDRLASENLWARLVPFYNITIIVKDGSGLLPILVWGIPIDILLECFTRFVLKVPTWGQAAGTPFSLILLMEVMLTIITAPLLSIIVPGYRFGCVRICWR